ncbi:MAG TPA: YihA family ribosome biogenesis GTP-binding protein [Clostridiales bacterium]|jgi:GTP-binding protein|nr:YihA family ribosome biogenesis GTP-binding protein [Clostridiales bacterium]
MIIRQVELVAVTDRPAGYPPADRPEIAFAGRSNVGKSSLINLLLGRRIAKVSGSPGKTRTINFYEVNGRFRIVDLPGYGYAKVSRSVSESWGPMIETFLRERPNLLKVVQLVDIRHAPTVQDRQMIDWARHYGCAGPVIATKADKLSQNQIQKNLKIIRNVLDLTDDDRLLPVSALKRTGVAAVWEEIEVLLESEILLKEGS